MAFDKFLPRSLEKTINPSSSNTPNVSCVHTIPGGVRRDKNATEGVLQPGFSARDIVELVGQRAADAKFAFPPFLLVVDMSPSMLNQPKGFRNP